MRSIWESIIQWLSEAEDDPGDSPEVKARLKRAHAAMAAKGQHATKGDQARRDAMARVMKDPAAARVAAQPGGGFEDELPGQSQVRGTAGLEPEELPRPDQPAPGTATGIGAGAIAAKNAEPTSVSLGARARRVEPGASGIKKRFGVSPDAFFADAPVRVDPQTGKQYQLRGRPAKDQPDPEDLELKTEPFAARHAAAVAKATAPKEPKAKPTTYSAGNFAANKGGHLPKGGSIRQTGKAPGVGASKAGQSRLVATGDVRPGGFHGARFAPAGHTAASEEEWEENPALSARRGAGNTGSKLSYGMQSTGQRGRMTLPGRPGQAPAKVYNKYTGEWEDEGPEAGKVPDDIRAQIAAKLALRGADIANKRFGAERAPWRGRADVSGLGAPVPNDANSQKANAKADAIASKPLGVNIRRDPESEPKHQYKPEKPGAGQSTGSAGSSGEGPIDRDRMKQMIAQRMAAMAAKKAGK